ncbi:MAG: SAM-dependent methyltransferase, partial [Acidimicrobiales bacterium]
WWGDLWAERVVSSALAGQAMAYGLAARADLDEVAEAWRAWSTAPDGVFVVVHGEVIARP